MKHIKAANVDGIILTVDDDIYEKVKDKHVNFNKHENSFYVYFEGRNWPFGRFVVKDAIGASNVASQIGDRYDFRRENIQIINRAEFAARNAKRSSIPFHGVTAVKVNNNIYYRCYYYLEGKVVNLGYYSDFYDAAVVREYTLLANNISAIPTGLDLPFEILKTRHDEAVEKKRHQILLAYEKRNEIGRNSVKKRTEKSIKPVGIYKEQSGDFRVELYLNGVKKTLGRLKNERDAVIYRNAYIVKNNLNLGITPLDIPIKEQLRIAETLSIRTEKLPQKKITAKSGTTSKYKGTFFNKKQNIFTAMTRFNGRRIYLGASKHEHIAAMMYNLFVVDTKLSEEPINKFDISLEEQRKTVREAGHKYDWSHLIL